MRTGENCEYKKSVEVEHMKDFFKIRYNRGIEALKVKCEANKRELE